MHAGGFRQMLLVISNRSSLLDNVVKACRRPYSIRFHLGKSFFVGYSCCWNSVSAMDEPIAQGFILS
jgi:hypothetical protein